MAQWASAGNARGVSPIPVSGRSPGDGNHNLLQYSRIIPRTEEHDGLHP